MTVNVYWTCYPTRSTSFFLIKKENRHLDEIHKDELFILRISRDKPLENDKNYKPYMFLTKSSYKDFAYSSHPGILIFNQRVLDVFRGELEKYGDLHPILLSDAPYPYYIYRVSKMVKALNLEVISKIDPRYQPGQPYDSISSKIFEFIPENIEGLLVFKDSQQNPEREKGIFLGQRFVDTVKKHKLTGLHKDTFKPIWPRTVPPPDPNQPQVDLASLNL